MTIDEIKRFASWFEDPGHPENSTPLASRPRPAARPGLANSVGFALAERVMASQFATRWSIITPMSSLRRRLMEGISHEAISIAGTSAQQLIVLFDDNGISIDAADPVGNPVISWPASSPPLERDAHRRAEPRRDRARHRGGTEERTGRR